VVVTFESFGAKAAKSFGSIFLSAVLLIVILSSLKMVQPGTVEVVTRFGRVTGRVLHPGASFILPIAESTLRYNTKKVIYETTTVEKQQGSRADYKDYPVDTNTKDGQQVDIFYTVRFSIDPKKATWVAQNIGSEDDLVEKIVKTDSRIWTRNVTREFEAADLYTGNVLEVQNRVESQLKPSFEENGIILDEVGIREIKFTPQYIQAIEAKQIEAVRVETEKNRAEQAKFQKEARITQAEGMAREQELLRASITNELLRKMWIEKWDGKLPTVMGSESNILDLSGIVGAR